MHALVHHRSFQNSIAAVRLTSRYENDLAMFVLVFCVCAKGANATWKAFLKPSPPGGNYTVLAKTAHGEARGHTAQNNLI